jgi:hypothetical protein
VKQWTVKLKLDEGATDGSLELKELDCRETLTVSAATDRELTMDTVLREDPKGQCASGGTVKLTALALGRATFLWTDRSNPLNIATGVLRRN